VTAEDDGAALELDLRDFHDPGDTTDDRTAYERLDDLLAPFGEEPVDKARDLVENGRVTFLKREESDVFYQVFGSRLYVVDLTVGEGGGDTYAQCTCPNGDARAGDVTCYHSIAARVIEAGLDKEFVRG
jgi:uncharacterized Zn finger protein